MYMYEGRKEAGESEEEEEERKKAKRLPHQSFFTPKVICIHVYIMCTASECEFKKPFSSPYYLRS